VPKTSWYNNLRNQMSREDWDKTRKLTYEKFNNKCGICGSSGGQLNCHEIWEYDDSQHTQTLKGFIALCTMCHHVKHIGLAGILSDRGELDFDDVIKHFLKVNECKRSTFDKHNDEAFEIWRKRSLLEWTVDLGEYSKLIKGKAQK
jgi:5-methylcytosine-specific restriction endonuclease McrA